MSEVRITCINKAGGDHNNPHEGISHYGWENESTKESGKAERQVMVNWIKESNKAYVKSGTNIAYCGVRISPKGTEFLQTYSDGYYNDNLLSLIECK